MKPKFRGILAIGLSKRHATNKYRELAVGKGQPQALSGDGFVFVSNSSAQEATVFNPTTGDQDLVVANDMLQRVKFASESSAEAVEANYAQCLSGCGTHFVYDDSTLLKYCPVCTMSMEEEGDDAEDDEDDAMSLLDTVGDDEEGESESSDDEGDDGDEDDLGEDDDSAIIETDDGEDDDDATVAVASSKADAVALYMQQSPSALSAALSSGEKAEVQYVVCSSADCGAHIVHDKADLALCPVCQSETDEPEDEDDEVNYDADTGSVDEDEDGDNGDADEQSAECAVASTKDKAVAKFLKQFPESVSAKGMDVEHVVCSADDCGLHIVSASEVTACPVCHSAVEDEEEGEDDDFDMDADGADDEGDDADDDSSDDSEGDDSSDDEGGDDAEGEGDESADDSSDDADDAGSAGEGDEGEGDAGKGGDKGSDDEGDGDGAGSDEEESEDDAAAKDLAVLDSESSVSTSTTKLNLMALASVDDKANVSGLDLSYSSSIQGKARWTAFYNGNPVAFATADDVKPDLREVFASERFGHVVVATARVSGIATTLNETGFKPFVQEVAVSAEVSKMVGEQVAQAQADLKAAQDTFQTEFKAALATATLGINRGFFQGLANPLRDALCGALQVAGVQGGDQMVDRAFSSNFEQFQKAAFDKAAEIMTQPAEVREALAKNILSMTYQPQASQSSASERLTSLGTSVSSAAPEAASTSAAAQTADEFSALLATATANLGSRNK